MPVSSSVVTSYYQAIMRATPTSAQVAALSTLADTTALTNTLLGSANNSVDPLIRVYQAAFGRVPDSSGLDYWVGVYNAGGNSVASLQAITAGFAGSTEFRNAYDALDNRGYVSALYANVLGRAGDSAGIDYWVGVLGSGVARSTVLREFASSAEFKATTDSLIDSFLTAAANGTQSYSGSLLSGAGAGREYNLTTNVDSVSGSAANDIITGVVGPSGTYSVGDSINGYAGNDTLNLIDTEGTAQGIVSLRSVETVNVRTITADVTQLDAADWSGVATLTNASSLAGSTLQVSGLAISTEIKLFGDTNANADFVGLTSGTDTATVGLVGAGSGSAATALAFASAELDLDGSGLLDAITLNVSGSSYVHVEGGDDLRTLTVRGQATNLVVETTATETLSTLDASGFSGAARYFISGRSDIAVVGGAGNDTFEFGTSLNAADTIDGGAGTDTIVSKQGNASTRVFATSVEAATVTLDDANAGAFDVSAAQSITSITVNASAANNGSVTNFAGGTINLAESNIADFSVDTNANATVTVNVGSASGVVAIASAGITDAATVNVQSLAGSSGTQTIASLNIDNDARNVSFGVGGSANLTVTSLAGVSGATTVNVRASGSAALTFTSADASLGTSLSVLNVVADGAESSDINLANLFSSGVNHSATAAALTINLQAKSGGDITLGGVSFGTGTIGTAAPTRSLIVNASAGASAGITTADLVVSGVDAVININAAASGAVVAFDTIDAGVNAGVGASGTGQAGSLFISAAVGAGGTIRVNEISGSGIGVTLGSVTVGASGTLAVGSAAGAIQADGARFSMGTLTLGTGASATFGAVSASSMGTLTIVAADSAEFNFGAINATAVSATGGALTIGAMNFTLGSAVSGVLSTLDTGASGSIGSITLAAGADAGLQVGNISAGSAVGAINLTLATGATATFGTMAIGGALGAITINASGASASATFGNIAATSMGVLTANLDGSASLDFGNLTVKTVNSMTISLRNGGDDFDMGIIKASALGDIYLNVTGGASADFDNISASAVGSITVSGSGWVDFGVVSAISVAGIDLRNQGSGGTFTIDLSAVTNGVVVDGGRGTTTITSSIGNDEFYLKTGLGTDTIVYSSTGQAADSVYRFQAGTSDDKIAFSVSALSAGGVTLVVAGSAAAGIATGTVAVDVATASGAATLAATDNIVLLATGQYTSLADMRSAIASGGSVLLGLASATAGSMLIVWTDTNGDANVSLVAVGAGATGFASGASAETLVTLAGVSADAFAAGNFDFV